MIEWQTLATLPRNEPVLVFYAPGNLAKYGNTGDVRQIYSGGVKSWNEFWAPDSGRFITHWMPLPEPPISATPQQERLD